MQQIELAPAQVRAIFAERRTDRDNLDVGIPRRGRKLFVKPIGVLILTQQQRTPNEAPPVDGERFPGDTHLAAMLEEVGQNPIDVRILKREKVAERGPGLTFLLFFRRDRLLIGQRD